MGYIIEFWPCHTNYPLDWEVSELNPAKETQLFFEDVARCTAMAGHVFHDRQNTAGDSSLDLQSPGLSLDFDHFWDLIQNQSLVFEPRPWGANRHFGPMGCSGCPPQSEPESPFDLPGMSALHWAAEMGHLPIVYAYRSSLPKYVDHERYHSRMLLQAAQYGHAGIVYLLVRAGANASDEIFF